MKYVAILKPDNDRILAGEQCVCTLSELYTSITEPECSELEITKEFANTYFTYRGLCDFVANTSIVFPNIQITLDNIVFKDLDSAVKVIKHLKTPEEFIYTLTKNPTRTLQTIGELCDYYFDTQKDASVASNKLATMLMQIDKLQQTINEKDEQLEVKQNTINDLHSKLHALVSRVNFRYEKTVDTEAMFQLDENMFNSVLYIKEISRVTYTDTLIYYLQEIVKTLYGEPIRCIVIEPYYAYKRAELYPSFKKHWQLTYRDVYEENIYMAGMQPKLMQDILRNSNHVHYLVVLDRSGLNAPCIVGNNVATIYTLSDVKEIGNLDPDEVISYSENTLNIPYIENFDSLTDEEKIQKYSTMSIMKYFLDILES